MLSELPEFSAAMRDASDELKVYLDHAWILGDALQIVFGLSDGSRRDLLRGLSDVVLGLRDSEEMLDFLVRECHISSATKKLFIELFEHFVEEAPGSDE